MNNKKITILILFLTIAFIIFANFANSREYSNLYNVKFVDSIEAGSLSLLEEPSSKLLSLDNPYDPGQRNDLQRDKDFLWDAALYNGKYYVYYGILPALLLYVPFHLITGFYLDTGFGVMLFSILTIIVLYFIYDFLCKKYFKDLPYKIYIFGLISLLCGAGIIWINVAPRFYELVAISGLYFTLQGLYLLITTDYKEEKLHLKRLFLASLCLTLAVACRPTFLIASIMLVLWFIKFAKENINNKSKIIKTVLIIMIPYIIIGSLLMAYNFARFGSIFEFGSKYQLTMEDMTKSSGYSKCFLQGLLCNLFNVPIINGEFPFIHSNANVLATKESYYIEDMIGGLFFVAPICFAIFEIRRVLKNKNLDKSLKELIISNLALGIILLFIVTIKGGSTGRYLLDFSWCFIISAILVLYANYNNLKSKEAKKIVFRLLIIVTVFTVFINTFSIFLSVADIGMHDLRPEIYEFFENVICFWKW